MVHCTFLCFMLVNCDIICTKFRNASLGTKDAQHEIFWVKDKTIKKPTTITDSKEIMFGVQGKARIAVLYSGGSITPICFIKWKKNKTYLKGQKKFL